MIYSLIYEVKGVISPAGTIRTTREEVLQVARTVAEAAMDQLDLIGSTITWHDPETSAVDARKVLKSDDLDELAGAIDRLSRVLKAEQKGYIDLWQYDDLFELIKVHDVTAWCGEALKKDIGRVKKEYYSLVERISAEWKR